MNNFAITIITFVLVGIVISIASRKSAKRTVKDTLGSAPHYGADSVVGSIQPSEIIEKIRAVLVGSDFVIVSSMPSQLIVEGTKDVRSGTVVIPAGSAIYSIDLTPEESVGTKLTMCATEKSHFLTGEATFTYDEFKKLIEFITGTFGLGMPPITDYMRSQGLGKRAGDFFQVLLIAVLIIGGLIFVLYLINR